MDWYILEDEDPDTAGSSGAEQQKGARGIKAEAPPHQAGEAQWLLSISKKVP